MSQNIIHETPLHIVVSYFNGIAYALVEWATNESVLFQGDDARVFEKRLEDLTTGVPCMDYTTALETIWADYACVVIMPNRMEIPHG